MLNGRKTLGKIMSEHIVRPGADSIRFWNLRAAGVFVGAVSALALAVVMHQGVAAALSAAAVGFQRYGLIVFPAVFIAYYCLQAAFVLLTGVVLTKGEIGFPRAILTVVPFLVNGRVRRAIRDLDEITYVGRSFGAEWVNLRFGGSRYLVLFSSRDRRLDFFHAVQTIKPGIRIYRNF
jgi:hypothetical protein